LIHSLSPSHNLPQQGEVMDSSWPPPATSPTKLRLRWVAWRRGEVFLISGCHPAGSTITTCSSGEAPCVQNQQLLMNLVMRVSLCLNNSVMASLAPTKIPPQAAKLTEMPWHFLLPHFSFLTPMRYPTMWCGAVARESPACRLSSGLETWTGLLCAPNGVRFNPTLLTVTKICTCLTG
jgi:hypothetical protein